MKKPPRPYQAFHVEKATELMLTHGFCGFLYKPGRGKTYSSLYLNENLSKNGHSDALMIICPNNAIKVWKEQIPEHSELSPDWMIWENLKAKSDNYKNDLRGYLTKSKYPIFMVSCESFQRYNEVLINTIFQFIEQRKVNLIIDESAKFKNARSKRTENLFTFSHKATFRSILNGTPTPKSIVDIWSQMECMKKGFWKEGPISVFESKYTFKIFVRAWDGKKGYEKTITWADVRDLEEKLDDLKSRSILSDKQKQFKYKLENEIENYTIALNRIDSRMKDVKDQIAPYVFYAEREEGIPPVTYEKIYFDLDPEERKIYKKLKNTLTFETDGGELITMKSRGALFQKFRQITGGSFDRDNQILDTPSKVKAMLDDIETHEENVLVITSYRRNIKVIAEHLSKIGPTSTYFGDTTNEERDRVVDDAKSGRLRFIVANSESIGLAVDGLQKSFHIMYVYDLPIPPLTWEQIVFRLDRSGQEYPVVVKYFLADETIDERCLSLANDKRDLQSAFENMSESEFISTL